MEVQPARKMDMEWIRVLIALFACTRFILWSISHCEKIGIEKAAQRQIIR
jgi:hypothetical protein